MPINPEVMRQVNYDAGVGGRNMPKNGFQRAQDFLRNKIFGKPTNPAGMTSQQQTAFDAKQGGKAMKDFAKTRIKNTSSIGSLKGAGGALGKGNAAVTGLALIEAGLEASGTDYGRKITAGKSEKARQIEEMLQNPLRPTSAGISGALPADYKTTEQQAFNEAAIHTGRKNREEQLKAGVVPGQLPSDYKETELAAGQIAENHRAGAGFGGQTRVSPTNVVQKGTQTSPPPMTMDDANKLLSGGYKVENPYSSNQLPYTQSSPYAGKGNAEIYNPETLLQHQQGPGAPDYVKLSKDIYGDQSGVESYTRGEEMNKDYKQMDVNPGEKVPEEKVNWANRTMADNSDEKVRRRSAFLDPNVNIMQAMRNQEAIQGRVYAGGKHWQRNKDAGQEGQNDFVEISADQARDRSYYRQSADEVFANHLGKAKDTVASSDIPDLPKDAPAPLPGAVPGNTNIDKSQLDTSDLMDINPSESIIGNNTPSRTVKKGTLFNR